MFYKKDDGILLDEIFIEENYRNVEVGADIITKVLKDNDIVYLWVYKSNIKAIKLYKNLDLKLNMKQKIDIIWNIKTR